MIVKPLYILICVKHNESWYKCVTYSMVCLTYSMVSSEYSIFYGVLLYIIHFLLFQHQNQNPLAQEEGRLEKLSAVATEVGSAPSLSTGR